MVDKVITSKPRQRLAKRKPEPKPNGVLEVLKQLISEIKIHITIERRK